MEGPCRVEIGRCVNMYHSVSDGLWSRDKGHTAVQAVWTKVLEAVGMRHALTMGHGRQTDIVVRRQSCLPEHRSGRLARAS